MESSLSDSPSREVRSESAITTIVRIILGTALLASLLAAGWNVYRRLPADGSWARDASSADANSELIMILRNDSEATPVNTRIEIYPIDYAAAQRDFSAAIRPGKTFDDFLAQRMKGLVPVRAQLEGSGDCFPGQR